METDSTSNSSASIVGNVALCCVRSRITSRLIASLSDVDTMTTVSSGDFKQTRLNTLFLLMATVSGTYQVRVYAFKSTDCHGIELVVVVELTTAIRHQGQRKSVISSLKHVLYETFGGNFLWMNLSDTFRFYIHVLCQICYI